MSSSLAPVIFSIKGVIALVKLVNMATAPDISFFVRLFRRVPSDVIHFKSLLVTPFTAEESVVNPPVSCSNDFLIKSNLAITLSRFFALSLLKVCIFSSRFPTV